MSKKIVVIIAIFLGIVLLVSGSLLYYKDKSKTDDDDYVDTEERFEILGGTLPVCSKDQLFDDTYESYRDSNIVFTNENYDTDKRGNRQNNSPAIKENHEVDGFVISDTKITSKRCEEYIATLTFTMENNTGEDINDKLLTFTFKNSNNEDTVKVTYSVVLKKGQKETVSLDYAKRIIDAYDYTITLEEYDDDDLLG